MPSIAEELGAYAYDCINFFRNANGYPPLREAPTIAAEVWKHVLQMFADGYAYPSDPLDRPGQLEFVESIVTANCVAEIHNLLCRPQTPYRDLLLSPDTCEHGIAVHMIEGSRTHWRFTIGWRALLQEP